MLSPAVAASGSEDDKLEKSLQKEPAQLAEEKSGETSEASASEVSEFKSDEKSFETAAAITTEELGKNRGAFSQVGTSYLLATSSNNSVVNSTTGYNIISNGAFNSSSGLVNVIQNSGNNVLIQSSTIVNMQMNQ